MRPLAVVFEFLHASSLLHDDVVDNAEFRRSQPAANVLWGNQGVVLVGDFLYSKSILMTVGYNNIRILQALSEATTKMAEGEVLQLVHADNLEISRAGIFGGHHSEDRCADQRRMPDRGNFWGCGGGTGEGSDAPMDIILESPSSSLTTPSITPAT